MRTSSLDIKESKGVDRLIDCLLVKHWAGEEKEGALRKGGSPAADFTTA